MWFSGVNKGSSWKKHFLFKFGSHVVYHGTSFDSPCTSRLYITRHVKLYNNACCSSCFENVRSKKNLFLVEIRGAYIYTLLLFFGRKSFIVPLNWYFPSVRRMPKGGTTSVFTRFFNSDKAKEYPNCSRSMKRSLVGRCANSHCRPIGVPSYQSFTSEDKRRQSTSFFLSRAGHHFRTTGTGG